ncbi:hypothetical protein Pla175_49930 [Pirellulimonas nuda]|uniref:DUF1549 domain-containing protein n=1 Tax=Pirellulimonas nuda TaxID=2528009 RepID=A0A518DJA1_9BACT|nr:DUF1549 domain-containing protein [Pirellulimonas nuda]QDU91564.1 hypothetical protein Pla175_49930 [Pirellulimonas nuda]
MALRIALLAAAIGAATAAQSAPQPGAAAGRIDQLLMADTGASAGELAPRADDATYLRRVWLDIVGDIPTPEHVTAFVLDPAPDKRARVVRELLATPQYGQNWARYWRDVILSRKLEDRAAIVSGPVVEKLTAELNANRPWDEVASEFITATGDVREDGATAILMAQDGRTEETTAEVARIFLGIQIQCAQCHDHPWDQWKREQFHELAAFFPRVSVRPLQTPTKRTFAVVVSDAPERRFQKKPVDGNRPTPEHYMPDLDAPDQPGTRMQPRFFLTSAELPYGTADADRRGQLADWLTDSPWFATALVNRVWSELVGEGFYEPIDDIGPDRDTTAPETVALLSNQFADSGYDLKWLMETICATQAYQRETRPRRGPDATPFTASVAQRLRGDQLYNAILTALEINDSARTPLAGRGGGQGYGGRGTPRDAFNAAFGYDPSIQREAVSASIPQTLAMMNTSKINLAISANRTTMLGRLLADTPDNHDLVDDLYLRTLCRTPTQAESAAGLAYMKQVKDRREGAEDLLWALLNSAEFVHRR